MEQLVEKVENSAFCCEISGKVRKNRTQMTMIEREKMERDEHVKDKDGG